MKLLLASTNQGKIEEAREFLKGMPVTLVSLRELRIPAHDFEETGDSFYANALLKASHYHALTKLPTLADDSGLSVDYLYGEPGVKSRRWPGHEATDEELMSMLLEKLDGVPHERRTARFICAMSFVYDPTHTYSTEHATDGYILERPVLPIRQGIPWSSLFFAPDWGKTYSQLTLAEKNRISHRGVAMQKIKPFIIKHVTHVGH